DERVLAAARAKANAEGTSLGRAVSDIALTALAGRPAPPDGFPLFDAPPGHVITDRMVVRHRDDEP
ncbi:MAG: hypothetical protein FWD29_09220, partial [Micrococcales bacterium]|nr:hypothetical protein [Micrococcales bacterium]